MIAGKRRTLAIRAFTAPSPTATTKANAAASHGLIWERINIAHTTADNR